MNAEPSEMDLFLDLLDLEVEERSRVLGEIDPGLGARLRRLLAAHEELHHTDPITAVIPELAAPEVAVDGLVGQSIQGFRILGVLGRGGMGVVYDALQESPRRPVALKVLGGFGLHRERLERFEQEGQFLAQLAHPGIAQVYSVGRMEVAGGAPFIAMEKIEGEAIDRAVAERGLPSRTRLELLAEVAETVSHVHTRGVIHRDLKPANILLQRDGRPRILDFGIARLDDGSAGETPQTRTGQILGSLESMSPEQVSGGGEMVDGRSDLYSLGVLGYRMLAERPPLDLADAPVPVAIRKILEDEAPPLHRVCPALGADVSTVIAKAMDKDPARRYASAGEFAADLRRVLAHEPIAARSHGLARRTRLLLRRHRLLATALLSFALALSGGLSWALIERDAAVRAEAEQASLRREAEAARRDALATSARERLRARALVRLNELLAGIIDRTTPHGDDGRPRTLNETIDELAGSVDASFPDDPYVRGHTHVFLSEARRKQSRIPEAIAELELAREAFARSPLFDLEDRIRVAVEAARLSRYEGETEAVRRELGELLEQVTTLEDGGESERLLCECFAGFLASRQREPELAERLARRACSLGARLDGEGSSRHAASLHQLAYVLSRAGRHREARDLYARVVARRREVAAGSMALATALQNLASVCRETGEMAKALASAEEALELKRKILGERVTVDLAFSLDAFAILCRDGGRPADSLPLFAEAEAIFRGVAGGDPRDLAICLSERAIALRLLGRQKEARPVLEEAIALHRRKGRPGHALG